MHSLPGIYDSILLGHAFFTLKVFLHGFVLLLTFQACKDSLALSMANLDNSGYVWGSYTDLSDYDIRLMVKNIAAVAAVWSSILCERQMWLLAFPSC